ncbi:cytochrome c biogenesis CcdA family protein, partial [candidate division KSB1 bacterium]
MWSRYWTYLWDRYQPNFRLISGDMDDPDDRARLEAIQDRLDLGYIDVPAIIIDDSVISGEVKILEGLEGLLRDKLTAAGVKNLPDYTPRSWKAFMEELMPPPTVAEISTSDYVAPVGKKASLAYFYREDCPACVQGLTNIEKLEGILPEIDIRKFNLLEDESRKIFLAVLGEHGIHPIYTSLPIYALADTVVFGREVTVDNLLRIIMDYPGDVLPRPWRSAALSQTSRIEMAPLLTVVGAGLVDGINPCAMSSLIFLIAYLAYIGRRRREVLTFGIAFTVVVFLTYLAVGLGLIGVAGWLGNLRWLMSVIYGATGAAALFLAFLNIRDLARMKRSGVIESEAGLSPSAKRRIHRVIRSGAGRGGVFVAGLTVAFFVTLFELGCTGQVYVPTLLLIARDGYSPSTLFYLLLYNLLFVLPLIVIFTAAYLGVSAEGLTKIFRERIVP